MDVCLEGANLDLDTSHEGTDPEDVATCRVI